MSQPDLLAGRYLLGDIIGRGGMGVVLRAWDTQLDRYVAVKLLSRLAMDPGNRARFSAEGKTLAALNHPGLITLFDAATEGAEPFLVMELVDGQPLNERCNGVGMDVTEVVAIGARLADALGYVHSRNIVHRDIKPSNVLLADDGGVKLADFGIARLVDGVTRHTDSGITMGTAAYVSPEQIQEETVTVASDIYSLGLVLLEALSGGPVFTGSPSTVVLARLKGPPRVDPSLPTALRNLLLAMTAVRPDHRPSADQVAEQLRDLLRSPATAGAGQAPTAPGPTPKKRRRTGAPAGGTTTVLRPDPGVTGPSRPVPDRSNQPLRSTLVAALAVAVVLAAGLLWLHQSYTGTPSAAGPTPVGQQPPEARPSPVAIVPEGLSERADDAVEGGRQAAEDAGQTLREKAQEQIDRAERSARQAIERMARQVADAARERARAALAETWQAIQDAITGGADQQTGNG